MVRRYQSGEGGSADEEVSPADFISPHFDFIRAHYDLDGLMILPNGLFNFPDRWNSSTG
jgi:hypothetical protein